MADIDFDAEKQAALKRTGLNPKAKKGWRSFIWDHDTDQKSPEEQRLLVKLDMTILVYACLAEFLKLLDQQNLSNAYVSGLKTDINLDGNSYNVANALFSIGYAIGQIPGTLLLQKYRPHHVLPLFEVIWSIATFATAAVKTPGHLAACRFFVGLAEAPFFPGMLVTLAAWYTPAELGKRSSIFFVMAQVGSFFSGYLQAACYNLTGVGGLAGWRWLFIMDGVMSLPIALVGFFFFPDSPARARGWWMTPADKQLAVDRIARAGVGKNPGFFDWKLIKRAFSTWHWYLFVPGYVFFGLGTQAATTWFGVWLQAEGYSVYLRNIIPTFTNLVTLVAVLIWGWVSDYIENRPLIMIIAIIYGIFPLACLSVWDIPNGLKFFSYLTLGVEYITPLFFTWANEVNRQDDGVRSFIVASMNCAQYAMAAWVTILTLPASKAPKFSVGYQSCAAFNAIAVIIIAAIWYWDRRDKARALPEDSEIDPTIQGAEEGSEKDTKYLSE
ncbi:MFS general substrate transporter [Dacryopinax primogenitus]|uniref:MFS general substrate transporter n=1 Tax=Dacryopinax primogenitus (strain DJM 731) TaxID=1858805 RepID=M5FWS3_DACPD|nr:MFS general substrate transporter [Dacryopinax primogenitus]EJU00854.1 MFS general substrate transporter [Dacryopinax primogenitus]